MNGIESILTRDISEHIKVYDLLFILLSFAPMTDSIIRGYYKVGLFMTILPIIYLVVIPPYREDWYKNIFGDYKFTAPTLQYLAVVSFYMIIAIIFFGIYPSPTMIVVLWSLLIFIVSSIIYVYGMKEESQ